MRNEELSRWGAREGSETHTLHASGSFEVRTTQNIACFNKLKGKETQINSSPAVMKDGLFRRRAETPQVRGVCAILAIDHTSQNIGMTMERALGVRGPCCHSCLSLNVGPGLKCKLKLVLGRESTVFVPISPELLLSLLIGRDQSY